MLIDQIVDLLMSDGHLQDAGSAVAFRKVDLDYVAATARAAKVCLTVASLC